MIDTLCLTLQSKAVKGHVDLMAVVGSKINVDLKKSNEYRIMGTYKNLRIYVEPTFVRIEGSLPKYYYGSNLVTLSRSEPGIIIDQLSNELSLPLKEAVVTRIDIAANIEVDNEPRSYFPSFGILSKYDRVIRRGTLYYEQNWCKLCIYDKIAEAEKHNDPYLTDELLRTNIMRYEIRFYRDWLTHYFGRKVKAKELYGETSDVCCELVAEWFFKYEAIIKTGVMKPKFEMTVKGLLVWCLKEMSRRQNIPKLIEACGEKGDRNTARVKREAVKLLKEYGSEPEDLVKEIDLKMIECTEVY